MTIPRWAFGGQLGAGGRAEVVAALTHEGHEVAIKRSLPHFRGDPEVRAALRAEASRMLACDAAGLLRALEVADLEGEPCIVMPLVRGAPLTKLTLSRSEAVHVAAQVAETLAALHDAGLVHRDLAPPNILLDTALRATLIDLGSAARVADGPRHGLDAHLPYTAPEQAAGEVRPEADVWALGVLLWELLAQRPLFRGANEMATLRAIREAEVAPPSVHAAEVSAELDVIVLRTLSRDASARPSASELGATLRALSRIEPPRAELVHAIEVEVSRIESALESARVALEASKEASANERRARIALVLVTTLASAVTVAALAYGLTR